MAQCLASRKRPEAVQAAEVTAVAIDDGGLLNAFHLLSLRDCDCVTFDEWRSEKATAKRIDKGSLGHDAVNQRIKADTCTR